MTDDLKRLEEVLDVFGADPARWPRSERDRLERLGAEDAEGQRLVAEARALEAVMRHAPAGQTHIRARNQIMAAIAPPVAEREPADPSALSSWWRGLIGSDWGFEAALPPAALMTAALAIGIYLGASGMTQPVLEQAVTMAALDGGTEEAENLFGGDETDLLRDGGQQ